MSRETARIAVTAALLLAGTDAAAAVLTTQIDGVEGPLKTAVTAAAEISQYDKQDITAAQVRRLYNNAPAQIAKSLEAFGYFNAQTDGELKETAQGWTATIHVRPGTPVKVGDFKLVVPSPARDEKPVAAALAAFSPQSGAQFDSVAYEKSKAAVQSALFASGYLDAKQVEHRVAISRGQNRAAIDLVWDVGPRYRFGDVQFRGGQFNDGFLDRYIPWHDGDFYSQTQLLRLQQKLIDADYFGIVDVLPDKDHAHDGVIPIVVTLAPAKRTIYTAGVFIDSDVGFGVKGSVTRRWLNANGHKLKVEAEFAQREKSVSTTYTIPLPGSDNRAYNFGAIYSKLDTQTVQSNSERLVANETRDWLGFTRTLGVNVLKGNYYIATIEGSSTLLYPEASLEKKQADDPTFVRRGYALTFDLRGSPGVLSDTKFVQARADGKWIHGLGDHQRVIVRGSLGATSVDDFDKLPPELRFFAGGDRSIRGYAFQTVGPPLPGVLVPQALANCARDSKFDCSTLIIGGKDIAIASAEYEYYFRPNWGVAAFVDAGDSFNQVGSFRTHIGAGFGVRWRSPVGMVRADLGVPVNDPDGKTGVQLHLVIGPDL